jgi:hypothetical protein
MSIAACRLPGCPWRLTAICLGADEVAQRFFDAAFELNQIAFVGHGTPPSARPSSATSLIREISRKMEGHVPHSLEATGTNINGRNSSRMKPLPRKWLGSLIRSTM